jgi:hypothetical protein
MARGLSLLCLGEWLGGRALSLVLLGLIPTGSIPTVTGLVCFFATSLCYLRKNRSKTWHYLISIAAC